MSHAAIIRARRRAQILQKIKELKNMITEAEKILSEISKCKMNFMDCLNGWKEIKGTKLKDELTSAIKVVSIFEGAVAEDLSNEFPDILKLMDANCSQANMILGGVNEQISNLKNYISGLQNTVKNLYQELASI